MWGAFTFDGALQVDPKGNIFLPNVGPVKVAGVSNSQLNALVTSKVKEVYQSNVNVYASLLQAQPVKVYVTGFVRNPGLYGGVTSDSLLNYLIKLAALIQSAEVTLILWSSAVTACAPTSTCTTSC